MASSPITSWQIEKENVVGVSDCIFGGSKITVDGDCSHEIKRRLLLGRKAMTNRDSILKSRSITLPTKARLVKAMDFPIVTFGCESWTACMHAQSLRLCPTLCDPTDRSPPDSSVHGILQERILKWVAISLSRGSSQPRGLLHCRQILYHWATWEALQRRLKEALKEGWMPKNWCFWVVVLEKTLESPVDCKIKPVKPEGNQPWILEEPTHWKRLMLGKTVGKRRRGWQSMTLLFGITDSMDMNLSKLQEIVETRGAWHAAVPGLKKSRTRLSDWTTQKVCRE